LILKDPSPRGCCKSPVSPLRAGEWSLSGRKWESTGISGEDSRCQMSDFTFHIPTIYQHTLHFYETTPITLDHPPGRESDEIYSEVEQLVRLFNAIKSKMKIKIGQRL
jgi:hypothetical protein